MLTMARPPRPESVSLSSNTLTIQRMEPRRHRGSRPPAVELSSLVGLGLVLQGEGPVEAAGSTASWGSRARADIAMIQTPDGNGRLELTKFHSPSNQGDNRHAPANTPGIRHVAFAVEDIDAVVAGLRAAALNSSASWSATRTATGSAMSAARRESSSS